MAALIRARSAVLLLGVLALVVLAGTSPVAADKDDLPWPGWSRACTAPFTVCSTIEVYQYWPEKKNRLKLSVSGLMDNPDDGNVVRAWMVTDSLNIELAKTLYRAGISAVFVHSRGTKESPSYYTCANASKSAKASNQHCWLSPECAAELAIDSSVEGSVLNVSHFAMEQAAHDLSWVLRTLGKDRKNVVLTQGLSSAMVLRMLQLHPDVNSAVVLMDFVNPAIFDVYNYFGGGGMDTALQHVLALCDDQVACVGRLGASEGSWNRLQTVLSLAKAGKLSCASRLKWSGGKTGEPFQHELRAMLAHLLRYPAYPFMASDANLLNLIPSLLYRVQRCNDKDVVALNALFDYVTAHKNVKCSDNLPVQMHWMVNDMLLSAGPTDLEKFRSSAASTYSVLPFAKALADFHDVAAKFPRVNGTAAAKVVPVNATQRMLLLMADADPLLTGGAASLLAMSLHGIDDTAVVRQLRGVVNEPSSVLTTCLLRNLNMFRDTGNWADAEQCVLDKAYKIDFINGETQAYYGTPDAWDFDKPNSGDRDGDRGGDGGGSGSFIGKALRFVGRALLVILLLAAVGAGGFYAYNYFKQRGTFHYNRVSDNFYENLHQ